MAKKSDVYTIDDAFDFAMSLVQKEEQKQERQHVDLHNAKVSYPDPRVDE